MTILSIDSLKSVWNKFKSIISNKSDKGHPHILSDIYIDEGKESTLLTKLSDLNDNKVKFDVNSNIISYKYSGDDNWSDLIRIGEYRDVIFNNAMSAFFGNALSITATKAKTSYLIGEEFSTNDITVTLNYSDGRSENISGFVVIPSTIDTSSLKVEKLTVVYYADGKSLTTTIGITVVNKENLLYELQEETTFIADNRDFIDTKLRLLTSDIDYTIMIDFTGSENNVSTAGTHSLLHCMHEENPYPGISISVWINFYGANFFDASYGIREILTDDANRHVLVIRKRRRSNAYTILLDDTVTKSLSATYNEEINESLLLGCYRDSSGNKGRFWNGTIHRCKIWNKVLSDNDLSKI